MDRMRERHRAWRALAAALLAACLALGLAVAQPGRALAETRDDLTFTVKAYSMEEYSIAGYRLFTAHVDGETKAASEVEWNEAYKDVVHNFITGPEYGAEYGDFLYKMGLIDDGVGALSFISMKIEESPGIIAAPDDENYPGRKATGGKTFATQLAKAIAEAEDVTPTATAQKVSASSPASFANLTEGFYLFYGADLPPIWTPVSSVDDTAYIKDTLQLAAVKQVWDGQAQAWQKITAAGKGQQVRFRVKGEAPNSVPPAETPFSYTLKDKLPDGLTAGSEAVKVYATNDPDNSPHKYDITAYFGESMDGSISVDEDDNTLTATCKDLFEDASDDTAAFMRSGDVTHIIFEYDATVNGDAGAGVSGYNVNTAVISYTKGEKVKNESEEAAAKVATFALEVVVADGQTNKITYPAKFTLCTEAYGDKKYLTENEDGDLVLVDEAEVEKGKRVLEVEGSFSLDTIPPGTYVLEEVAPPDGYKVPAINPMEITIAPVYNEAGDALEAISVTHNSKDDLILVESGAAEGLVTVYVKNEPKTVLPITGMEPSQLGTIIGALLVACGIVALLVRARRKARA